MIVPMTLIATKSRTVHTAAKPAAWPACDPACAIWAADTQAMMKAIKTRSYFEERGRGEVSKLVKRIDL
jgi:hypothetical protein